MSGAKQMRRRESNRSGRGVSENKRESYYKLEKVVGNIVVINYNNKLIINRVNK